MSGKKYGVYPGRGGGICVGKTHFRDSRMRVILLLFLLLLHCWKWKKMDGERAGSLS